LSLARAQVPGQARATQSASPHPQPRAVAPPTARRSTPGPPPTATPSPYAGPKAVPNRPTRTTMILHGAGWMAGPDWVRRGEPIGAVVDDTSPEAEVVARSPAFLPRCGDTTAASNATTHLCAKSRQSITNSANLACFRPRWRIYARMCSATDGRRSGLSHPRGSPGADISRGEVLWTGWGA